MSQTKPVTTTESNGTKKTLSLRRETVRVLAVKSGIMTGDSCADGVTAMTNGNCAKRRSGVKTA
jgi:hypothetical protein